MPNLILSNTAEEYNFLDMNIEGYMCNYTYAGNASIMYGGLLKTILVCLPFVRYFRFDSQYCNILVTYMVLYETKGNIHLEAYTAVLESSNMEQNGH